jgi:hypothetical protein
MTSRTYQRAEDVYRLRFLSEKYGLDPQAWLQGVTHVDDDPESRRELPDIAEMLDEERQSDY